jgi:hypothetical protein
MPSSTALSEYFCASEIRERFQTDQTLTLEQLKNEIFGQWGDVQSFEFLIESFELFFEVLVAHGFAGATPT